MPLTSQHITGFAVGLGLAAAGFYLYKRNEPEIDDWLRSQGISMPSQKVQNYDVLTLEELVLEKERLEDIIAERELSAQESNPQVSEEESSE